MSVYNDNDEDEKNEDLDMSLAPFDQMGYKLREDEDKGYE